MRTFRLEPGKSAKETPTTTKTSRLGPDWSVRLVRLRLRVRARFRVRARQEPRGERPHPHVHDSRAINT